MSENRRPGAFPVPPQQKAQERVAAEAYQPAARLPRAVRETERIEITPPEIDVFEAEIDATAMPAPISPGRRRSWLGTIFFSAAGLFVSMAVGLWTDAIIRDLFQRADWLGWTALALAATALAALLVFAGREIAGLMRLASVEAIRARSAKALADNDTAAARIAVRDLSLMFGARPETAAGRKSLEQLKDDVIDGADLIRLAETELLLPLDERAKAMVLDAAKRVSVVTAVSPRAIVDLAYVVFESGRLVRRLAELYGGRPGTLGFFRILRDVLAHLAVTGSIAAGDSIVQQIVGHGLAARLSARLGEGVVNGMMTARIGIAAMEAARPLAFSAVRRPRLGDILSVLTRFAMRREKAAAEE